MSTLMGEFEWYVQMAGREFLGDRNQDLPNEVPGEFLGVLF